MSQLIINTNRGTADTLKSGATKINSNFTELYAIIATDQISIPSLFGNGGKYLTTNGTTVSWQTFTVPDAVVTTGSYANPSWITSLNYSKLTNTPNLANYLTASSLTVSTITPSGNGALSYSNGVFTYTPPNLATVATSGSYADLTNKPTITAIPTQTANSGKYLTTNGTTLSWATVTSGTTAFSALTDATSASLTVDEIYLPAITRLVVTTPVFNYNIDQYSGDNPAIYAISGTTIAFNLQVGSNHPFLLQQNSTTITTVNLIHVSTTGVVSTGSAAQGQVSGTLYWKIPASVSGTFRYICQNHPSMVGAITVKDIANI